MQSGQNNREVYLLQMDQTIAQSTDTSVPLRFLETTFQECSSKQYVAPYITSTQSSEVELVPILKTQNDIVQYIQLKDDKPVHNNINNLLSIRAEFVIPMETSPQNGILDCEQSISLSNRCKDHSRENTVNNHKPRINNYFHIPDRSVAQRALAVLPSALQVKRGAITPRRLLPPFIRFGPIQGTKQTVSYLRANELISNAAATETPIFLLKQDSDYFTHIDVSDRDKANWMCLLPLANETTNANVWIYEENNELYGITTESIRPRKPLTLGYSKSYAVECGLPVRQPVLDLTETKLGQIQWWCHECRKPMASEVLLKKHREAHLKEGRLARRGRYRCRHCKKTFCRLYTMKRHVMTRFCLKNPIQTSDNQKTHEPSDVGLNITQTTEDNRLSSDESFQNFSNGLDFSTNLFDDRMHSLDISGNSRETDFNTYAMDRDDNLVGNLGFTNGLDCTPNTHLEINILENATEPEKYTLPIVVLNEKQNQAAPTAANKKKKILASKAQQFQCKCGRIFNTNEKLTKHVSTVCTANHTPQSEPTPLEFIYKCDKCQVTFKRRGMLVNHLWRVHSAAPAAVPVEKRIRHYPCVACPKIYSTAAKRNSHVALHHPECAGMRARAVEGGVVRGAAATCSACPRQYASRAKLLQHMRQRHPHLAPRIQNNKAAKMEVT